MTRPVFLNKLDFELLKKKFPNEEDLKSVIDKIKNDYPVQYAIGNVPFLGLTINVDERALIPRFETEIMVDTLIKKMNKLNFYPENILDLCTGSGCIALALKKNYPKSNVIGVDISDKALSLAKENAKLNNLDVKFIQKDILKSWDFQKKYSLLVSNPPYVKLDEYVSPNTKYEPQNALYAGEDNLIFYKRILEGAPKILTSRNIISFEIGTYDSEKITKLAKKYFTDSNICTVKDYAGYDRFLFIMNNL